MLKAPCLGVVIVRVLWPWNTPLFRFQSNQSRARCKRFHVEHANKTAVSDKYTLFGAFIVHEYPSSYQKFCVDSFLLASAFLASSQLLNTHIQDINQIEYIHVGSSEPIKIRNNMDSDVKIVTGIIQRQDEYQLTCRLLQSQRINITNSP